MSSGLTSIESQFNLNADKSNFESSYEFENFRLDGSILMLYRDDEAVALAPKVIETLLALVERRGEIVSKEEMMKRLWADAFVEDANLTQNIYLLRKTLGKGSDGRDLIETFRRRGYRFNGEIKASADETDKSALAELDEREKDGFVTSYNRVLVNLGLGNYDAALDWLEKAFDERSYWLIYLKVDPALDALRENPRFIDLQEKIFGAEDKKEIVETRQVILPEGRYFIWSPWYLVAVLSVLLLAACGLTWIYWREKSDAGQVHRAANISLKRLAPNLTTLNPAISPDGKYVAYARLEEKGMTSLWLRNLQTGEAGELLPPFGKAYLGLQFSPDGKEIYYLSYKKEDQTNNILAGIDIESGVTRQVVKDVSVWFAVSPDGGRVAFVRDTDLVVADTNGSGAERTISRRDGKSKWFSSQNSQPAWSPDGKRIAVSGGYVEQGIKHSELTEIIVGDGTEKRIRMPSWDKIGSVAWMHDDSGLYVIAREEPSQPAQIFYLSFQNGAAQKITSDLHNYNSLSVTNDSRFLVTEQVAGKSDIWLADKNYLTQIKQITFDDEENTGVNGLAFMPDGRIVYTSPRSGNIDLWIMNPDGSNQKQLTSNISGWNIRPRPSPDGRYIVFQSFYNNQNNIWRIDADGKNLIQLTNGDAANNSPDISPDGQWVYYTSTIADQFSIWKVSINGGAAIRVFGSDKAISPSASPDGRLIAVHYEWDPKASSKVGIVSAETGQRLKLFDIAAFRRILRWTSDSKSLVYIQKNSPNLWEQPIDGKPPRQLTNFDLEQTWNFALSPDNQRVAFARGSINTESVLIDMP
jgi:Tol biopolymer transport system component/DNA-binding winged helix-turn-helix (wHTH) protein